MKLEPWRIEDVPIPELSGLALAATTDGLPQLFAIGDRKSVLARAALTDEPLEWALLDLDRAGPSRDRQFEAITATADGTLLVLCEDPPLVLVLQPDAGRAETITLAPGDRGVLAEIFDESSSSGEGLRPASCRAPPRRQGEGPAATRRVRATRRGGGGSADRLVPRWRGRSGSRRWRSARPGGMEARRR